MNEETPVIDVTLTYDREGRQNLSPPKLVRLSVTPALAGVFARAGTVNVGDATPLSFTSLLIGMLTGRDAVSSWLRQEFTRQNVTAQRIAEFRSRHYDESLLRAINRDPQAI